MNSILWRKLWRDFRSRKGSFFSLVGIVVVGVGCYVCMTSVWNDLEGARERYYSAQRLADITIDLKRYPSTLLDQLETTDNIRSLYGRVKVSALVDIQGQEKPISGTAISLPENRRPILNDVRLCTGTWFSQGGKKEVILNESFAKANSLKPGDRIKVLLVDQQHNLLIVGTAMSPEFVYLLPPGGALAPDPAKFGVLYLPERILQESSDLKGAYNQILGIVHDDRKTPVKKTLELLSERLDAYGVLNTISVENQPSYRFLADEMQGLLVSAKMIPALFLGVAALILNILLGRIIAQQRVVIGTLKALGYSREAVTFHFLGFGIFIGFVGGGIGILFGRWLQSAMLEMYRGLFSLPDMRLHFYPDISLTAILICLIFAFLGTVLAVRKVIKLEPAEAMRPPPPEKGGQILLEKLPLLWEILSFRWKLIFRTVFRNPFRSVVSILAACISTSLVLSTLSMVDALDYMISFEFKRVSHQDTTVSLRDPVSPQAVREISRFEGVNQTEPQLAVVCDLSRGEYQKRVGVIGLPENADLYTPLDRGGNPIIVPESGLVLSQKLAQILHVREGDTLRMRPLSGRREQVNAPVMSIVDTFLGLSAYADLHYLNGLLGEENAVNTILARYHTGAPTEPFIESVKEVRSVVGVDERTRALQALDESFGETNKAVIFMTILFAGIIAFGSVFNAALVSLGERQREVGTLRVLGYTPNQVSGIFAGESFLLNGFGMVLGLAGGVGLSYLISIGYSTELFRFPVVIYPFRLIQTVGIMVFIITLAQLIIFQLVRKLTWLDALKVKE